MRRFRLHPIYYRVPYRTIAQTQHRRTRRTRRTDILVAQAQMCNKCAIKMCTIATVRIGTYGRYEYKQIFNILIPSPGPSSLLFESTSTGTVLQLRFYFQCSILTSTRNDTLRVRVHIYGTRCTYILHNSTPLQVRARVGIFYIFSG